MCIRNHQNIARFTVIPNQIFESKDLRPQDVGVLARLLSKPEDWRLDPLEIAEEYGVGQDYINESMRRLSDAGYVSHDALSGQFSIRGRS